MEQNSLNLGQTWEVSAARRDGVESFVSFMVLCSRYKLIINAGIRARI